MNLEKFKTEIDKVLFFTKRVSDLEQLAWRAAVTFTLVHYKRGLQATPQVRLTTDELVVTHRVYKNMVNNAIFTTNNSWTELPNYYHDFGVILKTILSRKSNNSPAEHLSAFAACEIILSENNFPDFNDLWVRNDCGDSMMETPEWTEFLDTYLFDNIGFEKTSNWMNNWNQRLIRHTILLHARKMLELANDSINEYTNLRTNLTPSLINTLKFLGIDSKLMLLREIPNPLNIGQKILAQQSMITIMLQELEVIPNCNLVTLTNWASEKYFGEAWVGSPLFKLLHNSFSIWLEREVLYWYEQKAPDLLILETVTPKLLDNREQLQVRGMADYDCDYHSEHHNAPLFNSAINDLNENILFDNKADFIKNRQAKLDMIPKTDYNPIITEFEVIRDTFQSKTSLPVMLDNTPTVPINNFILSTW